MKKFPILVAASALSVSMAAPVLAVDIQAHRVSNIIGMDVENPEGANLGEIEDLVLDFDTGQIDYVAVSAGGVVGVGEVLRAVPWGALHLSDKREVFILDVNKVPWENAMTIDQNDWPEGDKEFRQQLKSHYMAQAQSDPSRFVEPSTGSEAGETGESQGTQAQKPFKASETYTPSGEKVSEQPEARGSIDTDRDGVADVDDRCEDTEPGIAVGGDGCRLSGMARDPIDKDEDLVADYLDKCPMTVEGATVDEKGCEIEQPVSEKPQIEKPLARLEDLLFEPGGTALMPGAKDTLTKLVTILENNPDMRVRLEGHTDNIGSESRNEMVSQKRAESVKDYLVSAGIDTSRIKTIGLGESNPIATNATEQGRAQNRRVDIMRARTDTTAGAGTQGTFTARVPVVAMVPVEFQVDPQAKGCWVEMYSKDNFQGDTLKLVGPIDLADMQGPFGHDWENEIESLKTGPRATISIYDNENFKEHSEWVGPGKEVENLDGRMELFDSFRSMKVEC